MDPANLIAVISPCIRPPHYEEDIPTAIKAQLVEEGVPEDQIHDSGLDTAADTKRFYSYRVEKGQTGRMLALFGPDHATRPHPFIPFAQRITVPPWCVFFAGGPYPLALDGTGPQSRKGHGRIPPRQDRSGYSGPDNPSCRSRIQTSLHLQSWQ